MLPFFIRPLYRPLFSSSPIYEYTYTIPSLTDLLQLHVLPFSPLLITVIYVYWHSLRILLLSLLVVLAATNNVFRSFHGDLTLREIKKQPWLYSSKPKLLCSLYE